MFVCLIALLVYWKKNCSCVYPSCSFKAFSQVSLNVTQLLTPKLIPTLGAEGLLWDPGSGRGQGLRMSEHYQGPCRDKVSSWHRVSQRCHVSDRHSLAKWLQLSTEGTGDPRGSSKIFLFFLVRITWFISTKSIWASSSSTVKHFANEFSIIIHNLQIRRLRLKQQICLVQSQTMGGYWKLILWDPPGPLFTEQPAWSKISFIVLVFFNFHF